MKSSLYNQPMSSRAGFRSLPILVVALFLFATLPSAVQAQPTDSIATLTDRLPDDFAFALLVRDLRGQVALSKQSSWFKAFRATALGRVIFEAPELKQFDKVRRDLKDHFDLDWSTVRDDFFGDAVLFSYAPGRDLGDDERGLILLHTRAPDKLAKFINQLNELQKINGELKSLKSLEHRGVKYQRRDLGKQTQFYFQAEGLFAFATRDDILKAVLDKQVASKRASAWTERFHQADAGTAFLTLAINPRVLDREFRDKHKASDGFLAYWKALDAVFVSLRVGDAAELRLLVQARTKELPTWAKRTFSESPRVSGLWSRFPPGALLCFASSFDFAATFESLGEILPAKERQQMRQLLQGSVGTVAKLDFAADLLPNLGPDLGVCLLAGKEGDPLPHAIFALALKSGGKNIDKSVFEALQLLAGLAVLDHNKNSPRPVRILNIKQEGGDIKVLDGPEFFPAGVQPSFALKDGYFLLASSPAAIAQFRKHGSTIAAGDEAPILRLSTFELAQYLQQRRDAIVARIVEKQNLSKEDARQNFDGVLALLGMLDHMVVSQRTQPGQVAWSLRIVPRAVAK